MKNTKKKSNKRSNVIAQKITSSHIVDTPVGKAMHISDMFQEAPVEFSQEEEQDREAITMFKQSTRVNWPSIEATLLNIGSRPSESNSVSKRLVVIAQDALVKGQYKEAKIILDSLVQIQSIEAKA